MTRQAEVDALVDEAELPRPAADLLEHAARRIATAPSHTRGHVARARAVADAQARDPVARRRPAVARLDAQLDERRAPDRRRTSRRRARARPASASDASSSRKNSRSPRDVRDARVAPGRDADVLGAAPRARTPAGQAARLPAVADHDDVELDAALVAAASPSARRRSSGRRPCVSTTQPKAAHRSRLDVRIASRCPAAVIAATGTSAISSTRVTVEVARDRVDDRGGQRQQRRLDRHERAEERQQRPSAPRAAAARPRAAPRPPRVSARAAAPPPRARRHERASRALTSSTSTATTSPSVVPAADRSQPPSARMPSATGSAASVT